MAGLFITFEGGEGSGKTTQIGALSHHLRSTGREVVVTRDPGGTLIGKQIRALLLDRDHAHMAPNAELLLYQASRAQLVHEVVRPALAADRIVLCDRFTDSTVAYQGYGRRLDLDLIARLNTLATGGLRPDLTLLLDLDPVLGLARASQRMAERHEQQDRIEEEVLAFHQRVRTGYQCIVAEDPGRVTVLDASAGMAEIADRIRGRVEEVLLAAGHATASGMPASG